MAILIPSLHRNPTARRTSSRDNTAGPDVDIVESVRGCMMSIGCAEDMEERPEGA